MSTAASPVRKAPPAEELTKRERLAIGGLGALTPIFLNLTVLDQGIVDDLTPITACTYAIRVAALLFLGCMVAYLHKEERRPMTLFQLGLATPALLTGFINGAVARNQQTNSTAPTPPPALIQLVPSVFADTKQTNSLKTFKLPPESMSEQAWRGLTGARTARVWFVIVSAHSDISSAEKQAHAVNRALKTWSAEVYEPYGNSRQFPVVLGAQLAKRDADSLRMRAVEAGFSSTYLWTPPPAKMKK